MTPEFFASAARNPWIGPMHRGAAEFDGTFKVNRMVDIVHKILKED